MKITDEIYGTHNIKEPVLIDLINSQSMQRLKKVSQFGLPDKYYHPRGFSRYEHSVGTMLLLRILGATLEEQVAGLIHDASHTAFSHLIDWVVGDRTKEDYQDKNHLRIIQEFGLADILETYGYDCKQIADFESYPLLDSHAPDLCADRLDYAIREFHLWSNPGIVQTCIDNLRVIDNKIVYGDESSADLFARNYMKLQSEHWGHAEPVIRYELFASVLKKTLTDKLITEEDFYTDEEKILNLLEAQSDPFICEILDILKKRIPYEREEDNPDLSIKKKFRYVDPEYTHNGSLRRLSAFNPDYHTFLEEQQVLNDKGIKVRLLHKINLCKLDN